MPDLAHDENQMKSLLNESTGAASSALLQLK